jgi:hypothetical protein
MSEPTIAGVVEMLQAFKMEMSTMKNDMAALKEKSASSSDSGGGGGCHDGPRDLDRPLKF